MKSVPFDVECGELFVGDFDSGRIAVRVNLRADLETHLCGGCCDEIYDDLMAHQGLPSPVLADEGEQTMFDLVPFAGARRQMANKNFNPGFVGEFLQVLTSIAARESHCCLQSPQ